MPGIVIHTDGSCHGNPGPGGYSAIIQIPPNIQVRGHHPNTTNNQMEMTAVIEGLARLGQFVGIDGVDVEVRTDSEYVCNGFNKGWLTKWQQNGWLTSGKKAVANQELWEDLLRLTQGPNVTFTHVRGHAGDPMNRLCDRIANEEALKAERKRFEGREGSEGLVRTPVGSPEVPAKIPEASEKVGTREYTRGYAEGYEAARRDMANALNRLSRHPDARDTGRPALPPASRDTGRTPGGPALPPASRDTGRTPGGPALPPASRDTGRTPGGPALPPASQAKSNPPIGTPSTREPTGKPGRR